MLFTEEKERRASTASVATLANFGFREALAPEHKIACWYTSKPLLQITVLPYGKSQTPRHPTLPGNSGRTHDRGGQIAVSDIIFPGDFQGKYGHSAAWKSPIVSPDRADFPHPPICHAWVAFWCQFCRISLMSFLSLNLTATFRSRWYARWGQGSSNSLPQVVALHRRGAHPIRPVIRLE